MIPSMVLIFILLAVIALIFLGRFSEIIIKCREAMGTCSLGTRRALRRLAGRPGR